MFDFRYKTSGDMASRTKIAFHPFAMITVQKRFGILKQEPGLAHFVGEKVGMCAKRLALGKNFVA